MTVSKLYLPMQGSELSLLLNEINPSKIQPLHGVLKITPAQNNQQLSPLFQQSYGELKASSKACLK